jgi:hypothetical protein
MEKNKKRKRTGRGRGGGTRTFSCEEFKVHILRENIDEFFSQRRNFRKREEEKNPVSL